MVSLGTAVFRRAIEEARQAGFEIARNVGVSALTDTMHQETVRFGTFDKDYVRKCASDRWAHYAGNSTPSCSNLVVNVAS